MNETDVVHSLAGGALIGAAASLMLAFNGRIAGVSGILSGLLDRPFKGGGWRWAFVAGLLVGGGGLAVFAPDAFGDVPGRGLGIVAVAGWLVGFGTSLGNGCTSGHGVCGVSRLSPRSLVATMTFMLFGFLMVALGRFVLGGA